MQHKAEMALIDEGLDLVRQQKRYLAGGMSSRPSVIYWQPDRFAAEDRKIFRTLPHAVAHSSELTHPNTYITRTVNGQSLLVTRDQKGNVRAFHNICRHRGMRLVASDTGCKNRLSCPYHAWTYDLTGALVAAPHFEEGFPELEKSTLGLHPVAVKEVGGFIWLCTEKSSTPNSIAAHLEDVVDDLDWLKLATMSVAAESQLDIQANWKLLVEGGLEAYHFKVAHRDTIGPYFNDNQSTYRAVGPHIRSILLRASFAELAKTEGGSRRLRDHANILYTLLPTSQLLVQQDHVVWISSTPISATRTVLRMVTLAPTTERDATHWQRNHDITERTLREDFEIAEGIQQGFHTDFSQQLYFGRFESALEIFNKQVERYLS
jgi:phenylpropionate dioxygenase-like ring-hydroxylating dioxygenase large terminal subunit